MSAIEGVWVAHYPYQATAESELSFQPGDQIEVIQTNGEWCLGRFNGVQGWFSPLYGEMLVEDEPKLPAGTGAHVSTASQRSTPSPANATPTVSRPPPPPAPAQHSLSDVESLAKRELLVQDMITSEQHYIERLGNFVQFIERMEQRDTPFTELIMKETVLSSMFNMFKDIFQVHAPLLDTLQRAACATHNQESEIASCFIQFAPYIRYYAHYTAGNADCLFVLQKYSKDLAMYLQQASLPPSFTLEQHLLLPIQRYPEYLSQLERYIEFTPNFNSDPVVGEPLAKATTELGNYTQEVDWILQEEEGRMELLVLQRQFQGNVEIYNASRRIIRSGELLSIVNGDPTSAYLHLFNDQLTISRKMGQKEFKIRSVVPIKEDCVVKAVGDEVGFELRRGIKAHVFRASNSSERQAWMEDIQEQIDRQLRVATSRESKVLSSRVSADRAAIDTVRKGNLAPRARLVFEFVNMEGRYAEGLQQLSKNLVGPLGKHLGADGSEPRSDELEARCFPVSGAGALGAIHKVRMMGQIRQISTDEVKTMLRVSEQLARQVSELVDQLEKRAADASWSDRVAVSSLFASNFHFMRTYEAYAELYHPVLDTISHSALKQSLNETVSEQNSKTLGEHMAAPLEAPKRYLEFLTEILSHTPNTMPDHQELTVAITQYTELVNSVEESVSKTKNQHKLKHVRTAMIGMSSQPVAGRLADDDMEFIREGDLMKICRGASKKKFHFWLCSDYLIYGKKLVSGKYKFHRALPLVVTAVHEGRDNPTAIEIASTEKSFTVLARNETDKHAWLIALREQIKKSQQAYKTRVAEGGDTSRDSLSGRDSFISRMMPKRRDSLGRGSITSPTSATRTVEEPTSPKRGLFTRRNSVEKKPPALPHQAPPPTPAAGTARPGGAPPPPIPGSRPPPTPAPQAATTPQVAPPAVPLSRPPGQQQRPPPPQLPQTPQTPQTPQPTPPARPQPPLPAAGNGVQPPPPPPPPRAAGAPPALAPPPPPRAAAAAPALKGGASALLAEIQAGKQLKAASNMSSSHRRNLSARFSRKADVMMKDMLQNALSQMRADLVDSDSDDDNNDDDWDD